MIDLKKSFFEKGFTEIFNTGLFENSKLINLQNIIYHYTKEQLIDHDDNLRIDKKLQIPFKKPVDSTFCENLENKINQEDEIKKIINSKEIIDKFKIIFESPEIFKISLFRCKLPMIKKKSFPWHQDEGTWYLFNDKYYTNKLRDQPQRSSISLFSSSSLQRVRFSLSSSIMLLASRKSSSSSSSILSRACWRALSARSQAAL